MKKVTDEQMNESMEKFLDALGDGIELKQYEEFSQKDKFVVRQVIRMVKIANTLAGVAIKDYPSKSYRKILNLYLALYKI